MFDDSVISTRKSITFRRVQEHVMLDSDALIVKLHQDYLVNKDPNVKAYIKLLLEAFEVLNV